MSRREFSSNRSVGVLTSSPFRFALWLAWAGLVQPDWPATVLLLAPLVMVPLGLRLSLQPLSPRQSAALLVAAVFAALSLVPDAGFVASLLTLPWLITCAVLAIIGAAGLLSRRHLQAGIGADFSLLFLVVGGAWLFISRAGANPLDFSDTIVLLTAVHFHYAGFALPLVAAITSRSLGESWLVPALVVVGVPFTAVGITAGGFLEWVSATFMAVSGLAVAWTLFRYTRHVARGHIRWLTGTAAVALTIGMSMALGWAWSTWFGWRYLDVDWMARTHGSINGLGFGMLAIIGLVTAKETTYLQPAFHVGRPTTAVLAALQNDAESKQPTSPVGLLKHSASSKYHCQSWKTELPFGFDAGRAALRGWASHRAANISMQPSNADLVVGETVAIAIPVWRVSISATCRIVEAIDQPNRFGFAYATLPHHPEDGEESFIVERHPDGTATYTVTAVWRAGMLCTRIIPPLTRRLQQKATQQYLNGVASFQLTEQS